MHDPGDGLVFLSFFLAECTLSNSTMYTVTARYARKCAVQWPREPKDDLPGLWFIASPARHGEAIVLSI
jgi:hypothetical protein